REGRHGRHQGLADGTGALALGRGGAARERPEPADERSRARGAQRGQVDGAPAARGADPPGTLGGGLLRKPLPAVRASEHRVGRQSLDRITVLLYAARAWLPICIAGSWNEMQRV